MRCLCTILIFLAFSQAVYAQYKPDWAQKVSWEDKKNWYFVGVANAPTEAEARRKALENAIKEAVMELYGYTFKNITHLHNSFQSSRLEDDTYFFTNYFSIEGVKTKEIYVEQEEQKNQVEAKVYRLIQYPKSATEREKARIAKILAEQKQQDELGVNFDLEYAFNKYDQEKAAKEFGKNEFMQNLSKYLDKLYTIEVKGVEERMELKKYEALIVIMTLREDVLDNLTAYLEEYGFLPFSFESFGNNEGARQFLQENGGIQIGAYAANAIQEYLGAWAEKLTHPKLIIEEAGSEPVNYPLVYSRIVEMAYENNSYYFSFSKRPIELALRLEPIQNLKNINISVRWGGF